MAAKLMASLPFSFVTKYSVHEYNQAVAAKRRLQSLFWWLTSTLFWM